MKKYILRQELLHFGEKMKRLGAVAITLIFLASSMIVIPQNTSGITAKSGESVPVMLYFHSDGAMDTKSPTKPENETAIEALEDGEKAVFSTLNLEKSLDIDTTNTCNISFHIAISVNTDTLHGNDRARVNLTISVGEYSGEDVPTPRASGRWDSGATSWLEQDINLQLNFVSGWSGKFGINTKIGVKIASSVTTTNEFPTATGVSYNVSMKYDSTSFMSSLGMYCSPVNATVGTYDAETGGIKTEFEPNIISGKARITFKGIIQNAFGDSDIDYVHLKITGPQGFSNNTNLTSELGLRDGSYDYSWNYSKYSSSLKADTYIANLTVKTVQNIFYQTANFSFSTYGVYCSIDKTSALVLPSGTASCYIEVINTGAVTDSMEITIDQYPSPPLPLWNISTVSYITPPLPPGGKEPINLRASPPGNLTEGSCDVKIKAASIGSGKSKSMTVWFAVAIVKPYEVNLTWTLSYPQNYPVVSGYMYKFGILVTNKGGSSDTFTVKCTPASGWNIGWEYHPQFVNVDGYTAQCNNMGSYGNTGSSAVINLTVNATAYGGKDVIINITGESVGAATTGNGTRYSNLTLSLTRLLGIDIRVDGSSSSSKTVYVKNSDGSAQYTVTITTEDDTGYDVGLNVLKGAGIKSAVLDDESISVSNTNPGSATLTVTLAKGTAYGSYTASVEATIAGMSAYKKSITTTTSAERYYGVNMTMDGEVMRTAESGEEIQYILRVKNTGNDNASITLGFTKGSELCVLSSASFELGPGKEKNITLTITIPSDAKDGQKITVSIDATSGTETKPLTFEITVEKTGWGELIDILYDMSHFLILLIAVIVVFVALWIKRRR